MNGGTHNGPRRYVLFVVLLVGVAASVFTPAVAQQVEIDVGLHPAIFGNEYLKWLEDVWMPEFEKANPGLSVTIIPLTGDTADMVTMVAGGVAPDVVSVPHTLVMIEGVGKGWYLPLDQYIVEWDEADEIIPAVWSHVVWRGETLAVPNHLPPRVIAYNKNHFLDSGLDPENPPTSWEEMSDASRRLMRVQGDTLVRRGLHMVGSNGGLAADFELYLANNGGRALSEDYRSPAFHGEAGLEALTFMKQLYEMNNPPNLTHNLDTSTSRGFYTGEASMIRAAGARVAIEVAENYSDLVDMGIFLPQRSPQHAPATTSSINSLAIMRFTDHPDEAWKVLAHLMKRESLERVALDRGQLIPRVDMLAFAEEHLPATLPFYDVLQHVVPRPKWPSGAGFTYTSALGAPIRAAILGEIPPETALNKARDQVQRMLDAFWENVEAQ